MIKKQRRSIFVTTLAVSALAACVGAETPGDQEQRGADTTIETTDAMMNMRAQLNFVIQDAVERTGADLSQVKVLQGGNVQWRSSALGCPQEGYSYTEAIVPGALFIIGAAGQVLNYHAAKGEQPFYCPNERRQSPVTGGGLD